MDRLSVVPVIGHRLGEVKVSCAVGGVWSRARRKAEMPKYRDSEVSGRCGTKAESLKHRIWEREYNT
eukprot:4096881-Pyramimonas_sp.AAC.1